MSAALEMRSSPSVEEKFPGWVIPVAVEVVRQLTKSGSVASKLADERSDEKSLGDIVREVVIGLLKSGGEPKSAAVAEEKFPGWVIPIAIEVARALANKSGVVADKSIGVRPDEKSLGDVVREVVREVLGGAMKGQGSSTSSRETSEEKFPPWIIPVAIEVVRELTKSGVVGSKSLWPDNDESRLIFRPDFFERFRADGGAQDKFGLGDVIREVIRSL